MSLLPSRPLGRLAAFLPSGAASAPIRSPRPQEVFGVRIAEPRLTWAGLRLALLWFGAPLLLGLLALDLVVWAIGAVAFDACWAVWCVF